MRFVAQAVPLVPVGERDVRAFGEVPVVLRRRNLAPRRGVIEHDVHPLRGLGERGVYHGGEGVDERGPAWVVDPERAAAVAAEASLGGALFAVYCGLVDGDALIALDLEGIGERAEVDRVPAPAGRLAADGAVAEH